LGLYIALYIGAALDIQQVIDFIDSLVVLITIPNIIGLYILAPTIKRDLQDYRARMAAVKTAPNQMQNATGHGETSQLNN